MNAACHRESELLEVACTGNWPDGATDELRQHVTGCPCCASSLAAISALQRAHAQSLLDARVPSAGLVWWRAQKRQQLEAARRAQRPILVAQIVGLVAIAVAAFFVALSLWPSVSALGSNAQHLSIDSPVYFNMWWILIGGVVALVAMPLALLATLERD